MAKKIEGYLKLHVPAGQASGSPPIGPALGQRGLNMNEFIKSFNAATQNIEPGAPLPTMITIYADKSFTFTFKTPTAAFYLKKAANLDKAASEPGREVAGTVTMNQVREIAELKMVDLNASDLDQAARIIAGSARSLGLEVVE
jgi:large subunit ribosomal protein L11